MDFPELLRAYREADTGALETAKTLASGIGASTLGGVRGAAGWLHEMTAGSRNPGEAYRRALDLIESTQRDLTYQPRTDIGRRGVENVAKGVHAVTEPIERATFDKLAEAGAPGLAAAGVGILGVLDPSKGIGRAKGALEAATGAIARSAAKPKGWEAGVTAGEEAARRMVQESGLGLAERPVARSDPGSTQGLIPGVEPLTPQEALRSAELARQRAVERATFTDKPTSVEYRYTPGTSRQYEMKEGLGGNAPNLDLYEFGLQPGGRGTGGEITISGERGIADRTVPNYYEFIGGAGGRPDLQSRLRRKVEDVAAAEGEAQMRRGDVVRAEEIAPAEAEIERLRGEREHDTLTPQMRDNLEAQLFRAKRDVPVVDESGVVWRGEQLGGAGVPGAMIYRTRQSGPFDYVRSTHPDEMAANPALEPHARRVQQQAQIAQDARTSMQDALRAEAVAAAERQIPQDWAAIDRMRARRGEGTPAEQLGREEDIMRMKTEMPQIFENNAWQRHGYYYEPTDPQTAARNIRTREAPPGSSLASHGQALEAQQEILDAAQRRANIAARQAEADAASARARELEGRIEALRGQRDPSMPPRQALQLERDIIGKKYEQPIVDPETNFTYTPMAQRSGEPTFLERGEGYTAEVRPGDLENPYAQAAAQALADRIQASQGLISGAEAEAAAARAAQLQRRAERVRGLGDPNDVTDAVRRSRIIRDLIAREPIVEEGSVWRGTPMADQMRYADAADRNSNYERFASPSASPMGEHAQRYGQAQRAHVQNIRTRNAVVDFLNELRDEQAANVRVPAWTENLPRGNLDRPTPEARIARENELYDVLGGERPMPRLTQRPDFSARLPEAMNRDAVNAYIEALRADPERTLQFGGPAPRDIAGNLDALAEFWSAKPQMKGRTMEHEDWGHGDTFEGRLGLDTGAHITYDPGEGRGIGIHAMDVGSGDIKKGAGGGAPLYQAFFEHLDPLGEVSYPTSGLTGINRLRMLANVIPSMLRSPSGRNVRNLAGTASGNAPSVTGVSQDLPAIMRAETEEIAKRSRQSGQEFNRALWFDGENFRIGSDVVSAGDIKHRFKDELSPYPEDTGIGQKSLQRAAIFDYIRALPEGAPIDKDAMRRLVDEVVKKYGPIAGLGGAAIGAGTMQDELRNVG